MSSVLGRRVVALLAATTLALASAGPAAAAQPTGEWVTWFATDVLPAGTWPEGIYDAAGEHPFFSLHETWTLPPPAGEQFTALPTNGPYEVNADAPLFDGTVLLRLGFLQAKTSGTQGAPVCGSVSALNPAQPTRIVIGESNPGTPMTRAEFEREMATTTLTATLSAFPAWTLPMTPIRTEAATTVQGSCQFTTARAPSTSVFAGDWTSTDWADGSTQLLNVSSSSTPAVTFTDLYASVCANAGARSTVFDASGTGTITGTESGIELDVTFNRAGCGSYRYPLTSMTFTYSPDADALDDDQGNTWHRLPAGTVFAPCPPGTNCVQAMSGSGTQATLIADPGSTWAPGFGTSYFGPSIPSGNCTSGGPLEPNGVLGFQLTGPTQTKVIVFALNPTLVTHGIGLLKVCWNQLTAFRSAGGAMVTTGDLPDCRGKNPVPPCVLSKTSGQHNAAFLSVLAPANDPNDPFGYGHW